MKTKQIGQGSNIQDAVSKLLKDKPEGGEITLDDFNNKMVPSFSRQECIDGLRALGPEKGLLVTGRRGHKTRFVYGKQSQEVATKFQMRRLRLSTGGHSAPARRSSSEQESTQNVTGFALRIKIGDQVQTIPLQVELVGAEG